MKNKKPDYWIVLASAPTCKLVKELEKREGVETSALAPCVEAVVKVSGPAKVLVIID